MFVLHVKSEHNSNVRKSTTCDILLDRWNHAEKNDQW